MKEFVRAGAVAAVGGLSYWVGGIDKLLILLIVLLCIDYLTGILKAVYKKELSSEIGAAGVTRKLIKLSVVAVAFIIEETVGFEFPLRDLTVSFFIVNECISILENAIEMGVKHPKKLADVLIQLRDQIDRTDKEDKKDE